MVPVTRTRSTAMAKRKENQSQRPKTKEEKRLQAIYAQSREEFSAADLQKFTEIEEGIPLEEVIAEMEEVQRTYKAKKKA
jgi:hypothetical protein